jgi:hypothetical protein
MLMRILALALLVAPGARADQAAPDCADQLTASQRAIFQAVLADLHPADPLDDQVRAVTIALVAAGQIGLRTAPADAQAAAACLRMSASPQQ